MDKRQPALLQTPLHSDPATPAWGRGPFFRALQDLGELHDREVQALRDELEAAACKPTPEPTPQRTPQHAYEAESVPPPTRSHSRMEVLSSVLNLEKIAKEAKKRRGMVGEEKSASGDLGTGSQEVCRQHTTFARWSWSGTYSDTRQLHPEDLAMMRRAGHNVSRIASLQSSVAFRAKLPACSCIVGLQTFDALCSLMIIGNAVLMGISADWRVRHYDEAQVPKAIEVLDRLFTCWFLLELLLRIFGQGLEFFVHAKHWSWNCFDLCVVTADVASTLVALSGSEETNASGDLSVVRLLRVLRVTRALLIVRIFRFFRELRMMVFSVLRSGTSITWSLVLFFLDLFLFSVFFTGQVTAFRRDRGPEELEELDVFFGSMNRAVYTLFMSVSGGISWVEVSTPLHGVHWANSLIFTFFIFFTIFALTNIITGIFVDTAIQSAQSDRDEVIQTQLSTRHSTLQQMQEIFQEADLGGVGAITLQDLEVHLKCKRIRAHMEALGLQLDEARGLFRLLDVHKQGSVTIDEFIFGCMRLKGNARSIDLATLMYENRKMSASLAAFCDYVEREFEKLQPCVAAFSRLRSETGPQPASEEEEGEPENKQSL